MQQNKVFRQVEDFNGYNDIHFNMLPGEHMKLSGTTVFRSNKIELPTLEKAKIKEDYIFAPFRLLNRYRGTNYKDGNFYKQFEEKLETCKTSPSATNLYLCSELEETYNETGDKGDKMFVHISPTTNKAFIQLRDYETLLPGLITSFRLIGNDTFELEAIIDGTCPNDWRLVPTFVLRCAQSLGLYTGKTEWKITDTIDRLTEEERGAIEFYMLVLANLFIYECDNKGNALPISGFDDNLTIEDYYFQQARFKSYVDIYNYDKIINLEYVPSTVHDLINATFITSLLKHRLKLMPVMFWKLPFEPLALTPEELNNPILNPYEITKEKLELRLGQKLDDITYDGWLKKVLRLWNNAERVKHIAKREIYLNESEIRENAGPNTGDLHACINGGQSINIGVTADEIGILFINTYLDYAPIFEFGKDVKIPMLDRNDLFKPLSKIHLNNVGNQHVLEINDFDYVVMTRSLLGLKPNQISTGSVFSPLENSIFPGWDYGRWNENYLKVFAERIPLITMYRGLTIESDIFIH